MFSIWEELIWNLIVGVLSVIAFVIITSAIAYAVTMPFSFICVCIVLACSVLFCIALGMVVTHIFAWMGMSI